MRPTLVVLIVLLSLVRIVATYHVFSQTLDEPYHVASGMQWLTAGKYDLEPQHPPLARVLFALGPYLAGVRPPADADAVGQGNTILDRHLTLTRVPNLLFFLLALAVVGLWTRRLCGGDAAIVAMAIFASLPPILGHAGLATTDMAAAATTAVALFAYTAGRDARRLAGGTPICANLRERVS